MELGECFGKVFRKSQEGFGNYSELRNRWDTGQRRKGLHMPWPEKRCQRARILKMVYREPSLIWEGSWRR
jgi:hypothetical protein